MTLGLDLVTSDSGALTVRFGGVYLDDPVDPHKGAESFARREQVQSADHVIVLGGGLGYRVQRLREIGARSVIVFEPCEELFDLTRQRFQGRFEGAASFSDFAPLMAHLTSYTRPRERFVLLVSPAYRRVFPDAHERLKRVLNEAQGLTVVRENTVIERSRIIAENTLGNLAWLAQAPLATRLDRPLAGTPAFIVSAGPSLDRNGHLLARAAKHGAILAVNTSSAAVVAENAPIDVLVVIESLDSSRAMLEAAPHARLVALDLSAARENFAVPARKRAAFLTKSPAYDSLSRALGASPLVYGGSVATAAFSLAHRWGADPIVLVGQDLAYTGGRVYAKHTPYGAMRAIVQGNTIRLEGCPERDEAYTKRGLKKQPRSRPLLSTPAWGGAGTAAATHDLVLFQHWFEASAYHLRGQRRLINATEGGASIAGYEELSLGALLDELDERSDDLHEQVAAAATLSSEHLGAIRGEIVAGARELSRAAGRCLALAPGSRKLEQAQQQVKRAARKAPVAEAHSSSELMLIMKNRELSLRARTRKTYAAIRDSAVRVIELASQP